MARLRVTEPKRKRVLNGRESHDYDPKPYDLLVGRVKFFERRMEARTSVTYMYLDDL